MMRIEQFPRYLYEELRYDKLCIPQQYSKRYVLLMLDQLIRPFFRDAHAEFSFREYRQVAEYVLNSCYLGGERLTVDVLHTKLKISRHRLQAILDTVSRRRGEINSEYKSCMDPTNAAEKPLVCFLKGVYLCMPMMFCGIGFYLSAYNLIQPNHENIDRLIGKRIEVMVEKCVEFYEESAEDFDINPIAEITVDDVAALCNIVGAYNADGLFQAFEAMLKGSDGTLSPIKAFLTGHNIAYALKEYE